MQCCVRSESILDSDVCMHVFYPGTDTASDHGTVWRLKGIVNTMTENACPLYCVHWFFAYHMVAVVA